MKRDTNLIEAEGLALAREGRLLLQGLDFAVPAGKLLCITGENGAGKTTLLHALLGELPPAAGTLRRAPALARGVGFLAQRRTAKQALPASVREVVLSGRPGSWLRLRGFAADKAAAAARMEQLGLAALANRSYAALSGGQQQRVLLARALCAAERMLVLDEPLAGLDEAGAAALWAVLAAYTQAGGAAVMVTHDRAGARAHADLLLHLAGGGQAYFGPAEEGRPC